MNDEQIIAAEAAKEISYFVHSRGGTDEREFERIIQAVCEKAYQQGRTDREREIYGLKDNPHTSEDTRRLDWIEANHHRFVTGNLPVTRKGIDAKMNKENAAHASEDAFVGECATGANPVWKAAHAGEVLPEGVVRDKATGTVNIPSAHVSDKMTRATRDALDPEWVKEQAENIRAHASEEERKVMQPCPSNQSSNMNTDAAPQMGSKAAPTFDPKGAADVVSAEFEARVRAASKRWTRPSDETCAIYEGNRYILPKP